LFKAGCCRASKRSSANNDAARGDQFLGKLERSQRDIFQVFLNRPVSRALLHNNVFEYKQALCRTKADGAPVLVSASKIPLGGRLKFPNLPAW
jgi:hypothetical protein